MRGFLGFLGLFSLVLGPALVVSAKDLFLEDLDPYADQLVLDSGCQIAYSTPLKNCTPTDFWEGQICRPDCRKNCEFAEGNIQERCRGGHWGYGENTPPGDSLLYLAVMGKLTERICDKVPFDMSTVSTTWTVTSSTSSTESSTSTGSESTTSTTSTMESSTTETSTTEELQHWFETITFASSTETIEYIRITTIIDLPPQSTSTESSEYTISTSSSTSASTTASASETDRQSTTQPRTTTEDEAAGSRALTVPGWAIALVGMCLGVAGLW